MRRLQRYESVHISITMFLLSFVLAALEIVINVFLTRLTQNAYIGYIFSAQLTHFLVVWLIATTIYKVFTDKPTPYPPKKRNKGNEYVKNK